MPRNSGYVGHRPCLDCPEGVDLLPLLPVPHRTGPKGGQIPDLAPPRRLGQPRPVMSHKRTVLSNMAVARMCPSGLYNTRMAAAGPMGSPRPW
jgi:hypothetical protein